MSKKYEDSSKKRTFKWLKNKWMETCLKHRRTPFFSHQFGTRHIRWIRECRGTGISFLAGGSVNWRIFSNGYQNYERTYLWPSNFHLCSITCTSSTVDITPWTSWGHWLMVLPFTGTPHSCYKKPIGLSPRWTDDGKVSQI